MNLDAGARLTPMPKGGPSPVADRSLHDGAAKEGGADESADCLRGSHIDTPRAYVGGPYAFKCDAAPASCTFLLP